MCNGFGKNRIRHCDFFVFHVIFLYNIVRSGCDSIKLSNTEIIYWQCVQNQCSTVCWGADQNRKYFTSFQGGNNRLPPMAKTPLPYIRKAARFVLAAFCCCDMKVYQNNRNRR